MTSRVPDLQRVREALQYIVEASPPIRAAIRTVLEYEQDTLFLGLDEAALSLPADIAHAQSAHKMGLHTGLEIALNDITNIDRIQLKMAEIDTLVQINQEGNPDEDA